MAIILNEWNQILSSAPWSARRLHRSIYVNGYIYISGGTNDNYSGGLYEKYNDVWRSSNGISWGLVVDHADWIERAAHAFIFYDNRFWIIGGSGQSTGQFLNDVWYSYDAINWTQATAHAGWSGRHEFGYTVFDNKMWVIGGFNGSMLSDVWWSIDGISWTQATSNFGMAVREHVAASFLSKLWVFGGDTGSYSNNIYSSSDGSSWTFEGNAAWGGRREHELINVTGESRLVILGGYNGSDLNDVWESIDGTTWTNIPQISPFPVRGDFGFTDDGSRAYILGGLGGSTYYNDVWTGDIFVTAEFSATPLSGAPNLSVDFTDETVVTPDTWEWDFGDGSPHSFIQNPTHVYTALGIYTVSLSITKSGIPDSTETKPDYITVAISPDFTADVTSGPINTNVTFTNLTTGDIDTWDWDFGDGTPHSSLKNPTHIYTVPGMYTVSLTAYIGVDFATEVKTDYITINITADFSASPLLVPSGSTVSFTDESDYTPDTWDWNFGDGSPHSYVQNPEHIYSAAGTYPVTLIVTKNSVMDSITKPNYINVGVVADLIALPIPAYVNMPVQFLDQSLGDPDSWSWSFGDGTSYSTLQNPYHSYARQGLYTITLTVTKGSFQSQIYKEHYVEIITEDTGTGFVRDQGPTLIFD